MDKKYEIKNNEKPKNIVAKTNIKSNISLNYSQYE